MVRTKRRFDIWLSDYFGGPNDSTIADVDMPERPTKITEVLALVGPLTGRLDYGTGQSMQRFLQAINAPLLIGPYASYFLITLAAYGIDGPDADAGQILVCSLSLHFRLLLILWVSYWLVTMVT
jgi:hypothetical protein